MTNEECQRLCHALRDLVLVAKKVLSKFDDQKEGGNLASDLALEIMNADYALQELDPDPLEAP